MTFENEVAKTQAGLTPADHLRIVLDAVSSNISNLSQGLQAIGITSQPNMLLSSGMRRM